MLAVKSNVTRLLVLSYKVAKSVTIRYVSVYYMNYTVTTLALMRKKIKQENFPDFSSHLPNQIPSSLEELYCFGLAFIVHPRSITMIKGRGPVEGHGNLGPPEPNMGYMAFT